MNKLVICLLVLFFVIVVFAEDANKDIAARNSKYNKGHGKEKEHGKEHQKHGRGYKDKDFLGPKPTSPFRELNYQFRRLFRCIGRFYNKHGVTSTNANTLGESILTFLDKEEGRVRCSEFQATPATADANSAKGLRATVIFSDGTVLYDTLFQRDPSKVLPPGQTALDNHNTRPEVLAALLNEDRGYATRLSTSGKTTRYIAKTFFLRKDRSQFITVRVSSSA